MTVPAVLIGGQLAEWLARRVPHDTLRRFLAGFLIVLAVLTIGRAILGVSAGLSSTWFVIIAGLALFGLVASQERCKRLGRRLWDELTQRL